MVSVRARFSARMLVRARAGAGFKLMAMARIRVSVRFKVACVKVWVMGRVGVNFRVMCKVSFIFRVTVGSAPCLSG